MDRSGLNWLLFPVDDLAALESAIVRGLEAEALFHMRPKENNLSIHVWTVLK
jgi:hypothetical protein